MSNRHKIMIPFLAIAFILFGSIGFAFWLGLTAAHAPRTAAKQRLVIQRLQELLSTLKDLETGQRGYLLTGEEPYLRPYLQAVGRLQSEVDILRALAVGHEIEPAKAEAAFRLVADKRNELEETIRLRREKGLEAALSVVRSDRGKRIMDQMRDLISQLVAEKERELDASTRRADSLGLARIGIFAIVGIVNLVFVFWAHRLIVHETSRRENAAEEISRQRELLSTTLASIGDAVIVTDAQGQVTFMNAEAERLTRWPSAEAVGQELPNVFRIVSEESRQTVENPVSKVLACGHVVGLANHTILIAKDGGETAIDDSAAPIRSHNGVLFGVVLVFRDFSDHKRRETLANTLNRVHLDLHSRLQFDEIMQRAMASAALALNSETAAISLRRGHRWVVSYVHGIPKELVGVEMNDQEEPHALLAIKTRKPVAIEDAFNDTRVPTERMRKWGIRSVLVVPLITKDESVGVIFFNFSQAPIRFEQIHLDFVTQLASSVSLALENCRLIEKLEREIVDRTQAQREAVSAKEDLARANAGLEKMVTERTAKLQETIADLEQLSYSMAHDLRAPLRSMASFSTFLMEEFERKLDDRAQDYIRRIARSAVRMDALIRDVLIYSQVAGTEVVLVPVDVDHLVRDILVQYPHLRPDEADITVLGRLNPVMGTVSLVTQCISNYLGNAVKFVARGVRPTIRVWTEDRNGRVRVCVQDNGIGIDQVHMPKIWRIFERAFHERDYPGTGIGLSVVKRAAEKMGGSVGAISEPGKGSTFWLELKKA